MTSAGNPLGLYLHVPFCSAICNYCNFNRGLFDAALKARYVEALLREIADAAARGEQGAPVDTIYFGGGTPSLLEPGEVGAVLDACRAGFTVAADAEITLETNPETVTADRLDGFRAAGVNRLSFGVQSFRPPELIRLGRIHTADRAVEAVSLARAAGFDNLSLDLMMWLPGQSVSDWLESVDALAAVGPEHASMYMLEVYPNAPLRELMLREQWSQAAEDDAADMYLEGIARLERAGYVHYEISNVARPGRESRHNLKYWTEGEWLAFGPGAHATRGGVRWRNRSSTEEYISAVLAGTGAAVDRRVLGTRERFEEAMFMGLRLARGVDLREISARYDIDVARVYADALLPFAEAGHLIYDGVRLRLTRQGMLLANEIMAVFIDAQVR